MTRREELADKVDNMAATFRADESLANDAGYTDEAFGASQCANALTEAASVLRLTCEWKQNNNGYWDTACGRSWTFEDDGPSADGSGGCTHGYEAKP